MKTGTFLWILLVFSLALSVYAFFLKPEKFDYRAMAAQLVAQPAHKGTLADNIIHKGNHQMHFDEASQRFLSADGHPFSGIALYYNKLKKMKAMVEFSEGLPHGRAAVYFNNGKLKELSSYVHGIKEGDYVRFNRYGQRLVEGAFRGGRMDGEWKLLFPDGSVRYKAIYRNGELGEEWYGQFSGYASIPWETEE
jgi:hypothetical protein